MSTKLEVFYQLMKIKIVPFIPTQDLLAAEEGILNQIAPLRLDKSVLTPAERGRLSAWVHSNTALIVADVVNGLVKDPDAYPDVPISGANLQANFEAAKAAQRLAALLSVYAGFAKDHYLALMADCSKAAREVVRIVKEKPAEDPDLYARRVGGLGAAEIRLKNRNKRIAQSRRKGEKAKAKARARARAAAKASANG